MPEERAGAAHVEHVLAVWLGLGHLEAHVSLVHDVERVRRLAALEDLLSLGELGVLHVGLERGEQLDLEGVEHAGLGDRNRGHGRPPEAKKEGVGTRSLHEAGLMQVSDECQMGRLA